MLNWLWGFMIIIGIVYALITGNIESVTQGAFVSAKEAVTLCITMFGIMSFWCGLMEIAEKYLHMPVYEREVYIDNLDEFKEAGACGTAAVITPIGGIEYKGKLHVFYSETEVGPVIKELYRILCGIQFGDIEAPEGWIYKVN